MEENPQPILRRYRSLLLGVLLIPINIYFLLYMEMARNMGVPGSGGGPYPSTISLFANAILFLIVLTALNGLISRFTPSKSLSRSELLIVYVMLTISTAIVSIDFLDVLIPMLSYPFRFATPENKWTEILWPHLKPWLTVRDPVALRGYYEGNSSLYSWANIRPWLLPVGIWSGFIFILLFVMFCINTIVRRQWMQNDKLQFPIVELPIRLTEPGNQFFKRRLMWVGFAIAAMISLLNGLNLLFPSVPALPVRMRDIQPLLVNKPWNAIGWTPVSFYPYAIGLSFLLPLDMLFSCWFFYIMWRVVRILGSVYGLYETTPSFPFMDQQALGAYLLVGIMALWSGRNHLFSVFRAAFFKDKVFDEKYEPMSYRTAVFGLIIGLVVIIAFFCAAGLRWWLAAAGLLIYFLLALSIARIHAEFGPPAHDLHYIGPEIVLTKGLGVKAFSTGELATLSWFWWFNRAYRSIPIAYQLDGLKIAQRGNTPQRIMGIAIVAASVVGTFCGFWFFLHFAYERGASVGMAGHGNWFGYEAFVLHFSNWMNARSGPDFAHTFAIVWGAAFAYFLYAMKTRVAGWFFHSLGFAVSTSYSISTLWVPMMIAWLAKLLILKIGGLRSYRVALDFFLGLLLGDFAMGMVWPLIGWVFNIPTYSFMQ